MPTYLCVSLNMNTHTHTKSKRGGGREVQNSPTSLKCLQNPDSAQFRTGLRGEGETGRTEGFKHQRDILFSFNSGYRRIPHIVEFEK